MSRAAMIAFMDALNDDPAIRCGVETALNQPHDRTVVWAVSRYARSIGYAVDVADVDEERFRRLRKTVGVTTLEPGRQQSGGGKPSKAAGQSA